MTSVAQQVAHTAQTLDWFIEGASRPEGFDLNFEADAQALATLTSLAAARQKFAAAFDNAINFVRSRSPEELASPLSPGMVMGGEPIGNIVWAMIEHTSSSRAP
jgi:hypothetical protein